MKKQFNKTRPLSWSAISSFEWDPEQWYKRYVLGEKTPTNAAMTFGKEIGERLAFDPKFLPLVPRLPAFEHRVLTTFSNIPLVGYLDSFDKENKAFMEYKTSASAERWTDKTVQEHGQIDMYCLLIYLSEKIKPEDLMIKLVYIPVIETGMDKLDVSNEPIQIFETKRTMKDILKFGVRIKRIWKEMEQFAKDHDDVDKSS